MVPPNINEAQYTGNYVGKSLQSIGLSQHLGDSAAAGGISTMTILAQGDKYSIDLYGSLQTHRPEETPMLTIMESLGSESCNSPYYVWTDEYKGTSWWDISLDVLRQRNVPDEGLVSDKTIVNSGYGAKLPSYSASRIGNVAMSPAKSSYTGGILKITPITGVTDGSHPFDKDRSYPDNGDPIVDGFTAPTVPTNNFLYGQAFVPAGGEANKVMFLIPEETTCMGSMLVVWNKLRILLANLGYEEALFTPGSGHTATHETGTALRYNANTTHIPVYMAFPNISAFVGTTSGTIYDYQQVIARLHGVYYGTVGGTTGAKTGIIFCVDFSDSNESFSSIGAYESGANYDSVMIGQPHPVGSNLTGGFAVFGTTANAAAKYAGSISRMLFMGQPQSAPDPIPEGDKFTRTGNFTMSRESLSNHTQIFASPAYGITGTHQASTFRFGDDFQETRDKYFTMYKKKMAAAFMYGSKYETVAVATDGFVNGQPVRATGGLMDYSLFPIRHIKAPLAAPTWGADASNTFILWLNRLGDNLAAFRQEGTKSLTFMVSQKFLNKVNIYIRSLMGGISSAAGANNFMGGQIILQRPSSLSFGLEYYEFTTTSGILMKFIHDPSLDNTPSIQLPYWIYGSASLVSPRDLLLSIDVKNMKRKVLRPDKIYGNIQDIGQDAFMEAIRGESGFMLRFPQNHAIVYAPES